MPSNPNKLSQFFQELKRRKVIRVITIYAAAAFVILQLVEILAPSLRLPEWTMNFILVLLIVGFIITVIVSWIYDIHPEGGIVKTEPAVKVKEEDIPESTNSWKIATYVSVVVIFGLLILNIVGRKNRVKIDESLEKSIAVLPFQNFSEDTDQEYMCMGLTDEIINHLYKIKSFDKVISLTSVLNYRNPDRNIPEIADDLGVNYILEGVYKKIGDQLRVSAQLIEAGNDGHMWQQDYNRQYEEIISIQSDIAMQIADHLQAFLSESEKQNILKIPTSNQDAYEFFLRISYIFYTRGITAHSQALDLALEAIRLDPNFADPYAWAGIITLWKGVYIGDTDMQNAAMEALPFFEKALELDPNNASAHNGMGYVNEWARWDYVKAENEYLKSIELEPNNSFLYFGLIEFYLEMYRLEDVFRLIAETQEAHNSTFVGINSHVLSNHRKEAYKLISQHSVDEMNHRWVGESYLWLEEFDSAKFYLESALLTKHPEMATPRFQAYLALVYEKTNSQQQSQTIVNQLIVNSDSTSAGSSAYFLGWYYSWLGELDSAFFWLDKAFKNRSPEMPWLKVDPAFTNLKKDDRYWVLYERTGHKAYDDYLASKQH